ncbi:unnamed protein product [marine sediment metagenome]|uniref:Uncharacterized protein n=1 Tax=marine sediment metagenome TaxID=412755 RepID=X1C285_9ZZZZ
MNSLVNSTTGVSCAALLLPKSTNVQPNKAFATLKAKSASWTLSKDAPTRMRR